MSNERATTLPPVWPSRVFAYPLMLFGAALGPSWMVRLFFFMTVIDVVLAYRLVHWQDRLIDVLRKESDARFDID